MKKILAILALLLLPSAAFAADNYAATEGSGKTFRCIDVGGVCYPAFNLYDNAGAAFLTTGNPGFVTLSAETTKVIGTIRIASGGVASGSFASGSIASGALASGSIASGAMVDLGAQADSVCATDTGTCTLIALLKKNNATLTTINTTAGAALPAGTALIGKAGIDQTSLGVTNGVSIVGINTAAALAGNGVTGTGSARVTVASDNTPFAVKTDQTTHGTTDLVAADITKIAGTSIVNGGLAGSQSIGGTVATNVAITDNPVNTGGQAVSSENAAVTTARKVQFVADLVGKQIVLPYANPENFVNGTTAAMTGTTTTSLIAAPASGLRNYITHIACTNSHATVGTFVVVQDGSGGTTYYEGYAAAVGGGFSFTLPTPLRQPTTATAVFVANVTTGANVICSASGYKGA